MIDYAIKISEEGHSYKEGDAYLVYSSQYPTLKIFANGSWSVTVDSIFDTGKFTFYHNLGYKAMYFVSGQVMEGFTTDPSVTYESYPKVSYTGLQTYNYMNADMETDTLTISINIPYVDANFPLTFTGFYIIFYEPLT